MDLIKTYGNIIKKTAASNADRAFKMIKLGLYYERFRTAHLLDKRIPKAYQYWNNFAIDNVLQALKHPEKTAWVNIFSPVELLQCFDLYCLSAEAMSSYLSGFKIEDSLIDFAEREGITPTLCSYHKTFLGAIDSGLIPKAAFATTTSMICDGNVNTFRHLSEKHKVPCYMLDIPNEYNTDALYYVTTQLHEMVAMLEDLFHKKLDEQQLRQILVRENQSKELYLKFLKESSHKDYPSTLTLQMFILFATHLTIGAPEVLKFFQQLYDEVQTAPEFDGTKVFWVHLFPYYQETLQKYFNLSEEYQLIATEMNLDYMEPLDVDHPMEALATKMLKNIYNGPYQRKVDTVAEYVKEFEADGVINFCHWGCKQSAGGVMLLKEKMQEMDVPFLNLDGDGMDRRNSHDGQIKTRLEAFLELL